MKQTELYNTEEARIGKYDVWNNILFFKDYLITLIVINLASVIHEGLVK
jgi:hypothetical protein